MSKTLVLRDKTYQGEWDNMYPGIPGRISLAEKILDAWGDDTEYGWKEDGDRATRCKDVWIELRRRDE